MEGLMWILKKWGLVTRIHNASDVPILLIPYDVPTGKEPTGRFVVNKDLAKKIKAKGHRDVRNSDYDLNDTRSQTYIRFYAGTAGDDRDIKAIVENEYRNHVPRAADAKCCLHTYLHSKRDLYLDVNQGQVTGLDDNASQTSNVNEQTADGTQIASNEEILEDLAKFLKRMGEELEARVQSLRRRSVQ
ncbi:hypothetical protein BT93_E1162 [Corymbia citriodora subsp. variegata]|nr:hypothetical protein BT93_E1162 [Corymbia citriodora subsp. variegata]